MPSPRSVLADVLSRRGRRALGPILAAAALVAAPGSVAAHTFVYKGWEQLVVEAEQIFVGTVTATSAQKLGSGAIVTDVTFASPRVFKGGQTGVPIVLRLFGGSLGGETVMLPGIPRFRQGTTYLVFARGSGRDVFPVVGGNAGLFVVRRDASTGEDVVFGSRGEPLLTPAPPLSAFIEAIEDELKR
jgi:hypothetical protein